MGWSDKFIAAISADYLEPRYLVESVQIGSFDTASEDLRLSSFPAAGYTPCLSREGSSISYGQLQPGEWTRSYGTLTLACGSHVELREQIARGMCIELRIGFTGWEVGEFERVWLGIVRNLRWVSGQWFIDAVELPGALQNRFDQHSEHQNLFYNLPVSKKLDGGYDPSIDDPTGFDVNDASAWEANNTGDYVIRITPSEGNFYYVVASGLAGDSFTGTDGNTGRFDSPLDSHKNPAVTSPAAAEDGDTAEAIAWVQAHPLNFAEILFCSTGTGDNGPQDLLPASWGWGIPTGLVAHQDIDAFIDLSRSDPNHWDFLVDHNQSDGVSWLTEQLRPGGFFLSQHQGQLTARAVTGPKGKTTPGDVIITDDDLMSLDYECWDSNAPVEYRKLRVVGYNDTAPATFTEEALATRPSRTARRRELVAAFSDTAPGWTIEVAKRLGRFDTVIPERHSITCRGWRAAVASLGDYVRLTTNYLTTRVSPQTARGADRYFQSPGLVVGGGPDWFGSSVKLELLFPTFEATS